MKFMRLSTLLLLSAVYAPTQAAAPALDPILSGYAVLGGVSVTNTGNTVLTGNLGVSANSSPTGITGFYGTLLNDGPGTVTGSIHQGDTDALTAATQLSSIKTSLALLGPGTALGADLTGDILAPGVYTVSAGVTNLTGTLTLDGGGNANASWVFQMPSSLITSASSSINIINSGAGAGVFWNVGSSATLGANSIFTGNILASTSITMGDGVTLNGRALAETGNVTMINDTVNSIAAVPEPEEYVLMMVGLGLIGLMVRRRMVNLKNRVPNWASFSTMPAMAI